MATLTVPESPLAPVMISPSDDTSVADTEVVDSDSTCIPVSCGSASGELYLEELKGRSHWGSVKCIVYNLSWVTPTEFESHGGKSKSRNWKRSIYHNGVQLGVLRTALHPFLDPPAQFQAMCPSLD